MTSEAPQAVLAAVAINQEVIEPDAELVDALAAVELRHIEPATQAPRSLDLVNAIERLP